MTSRRIQEGLFPNTSRDTLRYRHEVPRFVRGTTSGMATEEEIGKKFPELSRVEVRFVIESLEEGGFLVRTSGGWRKSTRKERLALGILGS